MPFISKSAVFEKPEKTIMDSKTISVLLCLVLSLTQFQQTLTATTEPPNASPSGADAGAGAGAADDMITKTCEHVTYKELCVSTLRADPDSKEADLERLTSISIEVAMKNGSLVHKDISQKQKQTTSHEPFILQCLSDCSENYIDAIDQLEDSIAALDSKAYHDVTTWIQAAMSDAESCEAGFKEEQGHTSLITDNNTVFSHLCSNALALTNLLASGKKP